jgi:hypothetical protein
LKSLYLFAVLLILLGIAGAQALADDEGKPFAEARIVLQVVDGDAESQTRVLNVANNLIKHSGGARQRRTGRRCRPVRRRRFPVPEIEMGA